MRASPFLVASTIIGLALGCENEPPASEEYRQVLLESRDRRPRPPVRQSCKVLHAENPSLPSGVYRIDPDGKGGGAPFKVYCDMTADGGGWTYGMIVNTDTAHEYRTRIAGVTVFGSAGVPTLGTEYGVNLSSISYAEVRIDNFSEGTRVSHALASKAVWDASTYTGSDTGFEAKRIALGDGWELRMGYYGSDSHCDDATINVPVCFTLESNPVEWICDTDSGSIEGWLDCTGGEICGAGYYYGKKVWRDAAGACESYEGAIPATVYGFAIR